MSDLAQTLAVAALVGGAAVYLVHQLRRRLTPPSAAKGRGCSACSGCSGCPASRR